MYIGLFDQGDLTFKAEIVPRYLLIGNEPAESALEYARDNQWTITPGYRGLFLKVGGQF